MPRIGLSLRADVPLHEHTETPFDTGSVCVPEKWRVTGRAVDKAGHEGRSGTAAVVRDREVVDAGQGDRVEARLPRS